MLVSFIRASIASVSDRKGVTAAEYAVMAVAIVGAVTAAVAAFAPTLLTKMTAILPA